MLGISSKNNYTNHYVEVSTFFNVPEFGINYYNYKQKIKNNDNKYKENYLTSKNPKINIKKDLTETKLLSIPPNYPTEIINDNLKFQNLIGKKFLILNNTELTEVDNINMLSIKDLKNKLDFIKIIEDKFNIKRFDFDFIMSFDQIAVFKQFLIDNKQKLNVFYGFKHNETAIEKKCKCFNNSIERIKCFIIDLYNDICNDIIEYKKIDTDFYVYNNICFKNKNEIKDYIKKNNLNIDHKIFKPIRGNVYIITKINNQL